MKIFFNKKGSFSIFAIFLFIASICSLWIIINAAGNLAIKGTMNSFGTLWAKSILGEYDLVLRNRYGLLAFYGNEKSVEDKLTKYIDYSLEDKNYIICENIGCDLDEYGLVKTENLVEQIELIAVEGTKPIIESCEYSDAKAFRVIYSPWIIESLPSYGKTKEISISNLANEIKEGLNVESIIQNGAMDKYIMVFFKDYMETRDLGQTFFNCEVEYIISGEYNDLTIKEDVEEKIVLLRNILNLFYLYTCQEKREIAMALASSITPGAMAFITQGILLETWAFAEAKNDIKLLYDNNAVPLLKDDDNWALTADNVFDIEEGKDTLTKEEQREYILPQKVEGLTYSDYLKILLKVVPEETKALRIMDLIQINMKYTYYDSFLIKEYNCGLSYRLKINDIEYRFEDKYVKE